MTAKNWLPLIFGVCISLWSNPAVSQCSVTLSADQSICNGQNTTIIATVTGNSGQVNYAWSGGLPPNDTVSASPTTTTQYTVTVTGGGCNATASITITVNQLPAAPNITATNNNVCEGTTMAFSTPNQANTTFQWNFGDGGTANGPNTSHAYNPSPGNGAVPYPVVVSATSTAGCIRTSSYTATVKQKPQAVLNDPINNFRFCAGGTANLAVYDASTPSSNSNYVISWGDGSPNYNSTTAPQGVSHIYQSGVFTLTYTVTGSNGCTDVIQKVVYNITNPQVGAATLVTRKDVDPKPSAFQ